MDRKIKVLMVDDEEQFRLTTQKILNKRGFDTHLAGSGAEALTQLAQKPDVVILDVRMPGMDGHQVLKEIKKKAPDLPVIMLTGEGALPSAREALVEGAFDYLTKPCDIDLLTTKINEAFHYGEPRGDLQKRTVRDVMIPIAEYTTLTEEHTVREAIRKLRESFTAKVSTSHIMETGHRSLLVFDRRGDLKGILSIADLLRAIMPAYLTAPKPSMADSIQYSPMFWSGMFTREVKQLAQRPIREVMSPAPLAIAGDANLMAAAYKMIQHARRRLAVMDAGQVVGVIREQDLFFEMEKILRS
jgi:CheY-like chemotaxis protein